MMSTPGPEDRHQGFAPARTHKARDPEHLSPPHVERYIIDKLFARNVRIKCGQVANLERDVAKIVSRFRKYIPHIASDHQRNNLVLVQSRSIVGTDRAAVTENRDPVAHCEDLVELM